MIKEGLVLFSCLNNYNCEKVSYTYVYYTPRFKEQIEVIETQLTNRLNEHIKTKIVPVLMALNNKQLNINLGYNSTLNINNNVSLKITFTKSF